MEFKSENSFDMKFPTFQCFTSTKQPFRLNYVHLFLFSPFFYTTYKFLHWKLSRWNIFWDLFKKKLISVVVEYFQKKKKKEIIVERTDKNFIECKSKIRSFHLFDIISFYYTFAELVKNELPRLSIAYESQSISAFISADILQLPPSHLFHNPNLRLTVKIQQNFVSNLTCHHFSLLLLTNFYRFSDTCFVLICIFPNFSKFLKCHYDYSSKRTKRYTTKTRTLHRSVSRKFLNYEATQ